MEKEQMEDRLLSEMMAREERLTRSRIAKERWSTASRSKVEDMDTSEECIDTEEWMETEMEEHDSLTNMMLDLGIEDSFMEYAESGEDDGMMIFDEKKEHAFLDDFLRGVDEHLEAGGNLEEPTGPEETKEYVATTAPGVCKPRSEPAWRKCRGSVAKKLPLSDQSNIAVELESEKNTTYNTHNICAARVGPHARNSTNINMVLEHDRVHTNAYFNGGSWYLTGWLARNNNISDGGVKITDQTENNILCKNKLGCAHITRSRQGATPSRVVQPNNTGCTNPFKRLRSATPRLVNNVCPGGGGTGTRRIVVARRRRIRHIISSDNNIKNTNTQFSENIDWVVDPRMTDLTAREEASSAGGLVHGLEEGAGGVGDRPDVARGGRIIGGNVRRAVQRLEEGTAGTAVLSSKTTVKPRFVRARRRSGVKPDKLIQTRMDSLLSWGEGGAIITQISGLVKVTEKRKEFPADLKSSGGKLRKIT